MSGFVLDASVAASWAFADEFDPVAQRALEALRDGADAVAPSLWWFELRNVVLVAERRNRLRQRDGELFLKAVAGFQIDLVPVMTSDSAIFSLARRHALTFYDAAYLHLAMSTENPLATLDRALIDAAKRETISLFGR